MGVVCVDVRVGMWWEAGKELVKVFESDGHGCETHGLLPYCMYDFIDDHGCGFEEFGHDGVAVIEDGSATEVAFLAF